MTVRPATPLLAAAVALAAAGCGGHAHSAATGATVQDCVWRATDQARMKLVAAAYRAGRLGSAATIRRQVHALGPQPGFKVTPFLRSDGTLVPWSAMSANQQRTLNAWFESTPGVASKVGEEKLRRAIDRAQDACVDHPG